MYLVENVKACTTKKAQGTRHKAQGTKEGVG
jgi:hypothetical protein